MPETGTGAQNPDGAKPRRGVFKVWSWLISGLSGEWLLTRFELANGGSVIAARALMAALALQLIALGLTNIVDPTRSWAFDLNEARQQLCERANWLGTLFAVVYAALYARFASQWTYLAGVYNQIKATECKGPCDPAKIAEWKAGFIADAETLHLHQKLLFAEVIVAWRTESIVKEAERIRSERPPAP